MSGDDAGHRLPVELADHRWPDVERLAAKYMNGDTTWFVDQAIELVAFMDRQDPKNLRMLFDDLLEYGAEGLDEFHRVVEGGQRKRAERQQQEPKPEN